MFKVAVFLCLMLCSSLVSAQESIIVAVASSFYDKAQQFSAQFEAIHDVKVRLVSGSTGRLYNQIKQGAPFDVFIAADKERPALLQGKKVVIGSGYLGVQVGDAVVQDIQVLTSSSVKHIAIANVFTAPFGQAAKQVLEQESLWESLKPKLVYTQNAMQAAMMVNQGLVDAAFVPVAKDKSFLATIPYIGIDVSNQPLTFSYLEWVAHQYD